MVEPLGSAVTEIAALDERLTRILRGHDAIETQTLFKIARPIFAIAGWRATVRSDALRRLLEVLRDRGEPEAALAEAAKELEANVAALERVAIIRRRSPTAHAAWLRRVADVLGAVERAVTRGDAEGARRAGRADPLFAPLSACRADVTDDVPIVDLELAAIDHLFAAARAETMLLGRRRGLFLAARQRLLEASAALTLDREGVRARTAYVAREIVRIDRLEAAGLDPEISLIHQARRALVRHEPDTLFAALAAIDAHALGASDHEVATRTGSALRRVVGSEEERRASLDQSAHEVLGDVARLVEEAAYDARASAQAKLGSSFLGYFPEGDERLLLRAALSADGLFEVGGALAPVRVPHEVRAFRLVRHPTQRMEIVTAEDANDLRDAIVSDPRSILLDLAAGRLFARRFVRLETRTVTRTVLQSEVRIYVLDGSGSMRGPRARVRDGILVAELSTLMRRLATPGDVRTTLFYRYFDSDLGPVARVGSIGEATDAIRDIVSTERSGGTDIERALLASLSQIAAARAEDPDLARAHVVLVTDGEASVDEAALSAARDALGGLPTGISVIALGAENEALRGIVARQRAKGEAAFYHFLDDAELRAITDGSLACEDLVHLPKPDLAALLEEEAGPLLDDLESLDRDREHTALEHLEAEAQARREVGLSDEPTEAESARIESLRRDRVALTARFARWFPEPAMPRSGSPNRDDADAASCALASIAEVIALVGGTELSRQADAIELLERMLPDAGLTPSRYRALVRAPSAQLAEALLGVRDAVGCGQPRVSF